MPPEPRVLTEFFADSSLVCTPANAIDVTEDGHYLVSMRHLSQVIKIDSQSGDIIWKLGGVDGDFAFEADPLGGFSLQHAIRELPNGNTLITYGFLPRVPDQGGASAQVTEGHLSEPMISGPEDRDHVDHAELAGDHLLDRISRSRCRGVDTQHREDRLRAIATVAFLLEALLEVVAGEEAPRRHAPAALDHEEDLAQLDGVAGRDLGRFARLEALRAQLRGKAAAQVLERKRRAQRKPGVPRGRRRRRRPGRSPHRFR